MPRLLPRAPPCIPWPAQGMGGGAWLKLKRIRSLCNVASGRKRSTVLTVTTCSSSRKRKEEDSEKKRSRTREKWESSPSCKNVQEIRSRMLSREVIRISSIESQFSVRHPLQLENSSKLFLIKNYFEQIVMER